MTATDDSEKKEIGTVLAPRYRIVPRSPKAPSPEPRARCAGFTLMELVVVLVLIAMAAALVVPRLPSSGSMALKSSSRSTAALLRYLGERSSSSKNIYRLHIDIAANSLKVTCKLPNGDEIPPDDPLLARKVLESGVVIGDVQSPRLGKITAGEVLIDFGAAGLSEVVALHLTSEKGESFTIVGYPSGGKVKLLSGYQESAL